MTSPATIASCVEEGVRLLAEAGIRDPRREARLILAHALGVEPVTVMGYPERAVVDTDAYRRLLARRAAREPLSHLTSRREFWSLEFEVTPSTLDPRPDSEAVVEAALAAIDDTDAAVSIADFGTGTGCLLLALLSELPDATGIGIDLSQDALAVARRNAARLGLTERAYFAVADWGAALKGSFDLIVANPPYIPAGEIENLEPEVARYEPRPALDGGSDGLDAYRRLAPDIARLLTPDGHAVFEFGLGQGPRVASIMTAEGLSICGFRADLTAHDRCVVVSKM